MRKLLLVILIAFALCGALDAAQSPSIYAFNAASFRAGLSTGIVSIFPGSIQPFTSITAAAGTTPLPTTLAGARVLIEGEAAPLLFVSPVQINFIIADRFAGRRVNVEVIGSHGQRHYAEMPVSSSPGVFTANARGFGLASGLVYSPSDSTFRLIAKTQNQPLPVDVGPAANPNYLVLFTTGLRGQASARIDGIALPVTFAGPHPTLAGVEQVNIQLSPALADRGLCEIVIAAEGGQANPVTVFFK